MKIIEGMWLWLIEGSEFKKFVFGICCLKMVKFGSGEMICMKC